MGLIIIGLGTLKQKQYRLIRIFDYDYGCAYGSNGRHQWLDIEH